MDVMEHPFMCAAADWLRTGAAVRHAERTMRIHGVQVSTDEVLGDARVKVWRRLVNNPDGLDPVDAERYCRIVVRHVVTDLLRGFEDEPLDVPPGSAAVPSDHVLIAPPLHEPAESAHADGLRSAIEAGCHAQPWVTSAALSFVTLTQHPDLDLTGAPRPRAGANAEQARMWPCLWFAGKSDGIFPGESGGSAAQRQRLSRAAAQVQGALQLAVTTYQLSKVSR